MPCSILAFICASLLRHLQKVYELLQSGRNRRFCPLSCVFFAEYPCLRGYPYHVICMDRADKGTMTKRTVHHFLKKYTLRVMHTSLL